MMSSSLINAALNLQSRFEVLDIPIRNLDDEIWKDVPSYLECIPIWIREMLAQFRLLGGVLEYYDDKSKFVRSFRLFGIDEYILYLKPESHFRKLLDYGYLPIATEHDGNVWVLEGFAEDGQVYHFDDSTWNGIESPSTRNGLRFAASRLSYMFYSMGISESSYDSLDFPKKIIWYP